MGQIKGGQRYAAGREFASWGYRARGRFRKGKHEMTKKGRCGRTTN